MVQLHMNVLPEYLAESKLDSVDAYYTRANVLERGRIAVSLFSFSWHHRQQTGVVGAGGSRVKAAGVPAAV